MKDHMINLIFFCKFYLLLKLKKSNLCEQNLNGESKTQDNVSLPDASVFG